MKLFRWGPRGEERPGLLDGNGQMRDLTGFLSDIDSVAVSAAGQAALSAQIPEDFPLVPDGARLGPCIARPGKIIGVGLNYSDHAEELGQEIPTEPILFLKAASAVSGPTDPIPVPPDTTKLDWEVELAAVIGTGGCRIPQETALDHVAGYCVCNDLTARDWQFERGGTWDKGKCADGFAPLGPWLVTRDEVADPQALALWCEVDGVKRQNGTTATMIFGVAYLVSYISRFMSLQPGDVITTGTPPGVGMGHDPQVWLAPGQTVRCGVSGLGEQVQPVVAVEA